MIKTKPNFFLVGQPKTGTSAMDYFLRQHPDVHMSSKKEPCYFCKDIHAASDRYHGKGNIHYKTRDLDRYLKFFSGCNGEKAVGEASTNYLFSETAAREIYKFNKNAKIVIILREPSDWMHSWYYQCCLANGEFLSFEDAVRAEPRRRKGELLPSGCREPRYLYYAGRCNYCEQVKRYLTTFCQNNVKIIIYDDYSKNNAKTFGEVLDFLAVDPDFDPDTKRVNSRKKIRFDSLYKLLKTAEAIRLTRMMIPSQKARDFLKFKLMNRLLIREWSAKPVMRPEFEMEIKKQCKQEVEALSGLLRRDLVKEWGYDEL